MSPPSVSVVVPAHAAGADVERCLRSIAALQPAPLERVLASDGAPSELAALGASAGFRVVASEVRRGPAHARNLGARAATGELLLFLDSDVLAPPDLVGRVARAFAEDPALAALIGSYDDSPAAPGLVSRYRNLLHHHVHQTSNPAASTFWAGCGAMRRADFLALGGFDESFVTPSVEDIDLGYRLRRAGRSILLAKEIQVTHLKRWTLASFVWTDLARRALPWTRLMLREGHVLNDLNLGIRHRLSLAATAGVCLCLVLAPFERGWLAAAAVCVMAFLALNRGFLAFLWRRGGPSLAAAGVPLHLLHSLAGGVGFAAGLAAWLVGGKKSA